MAAVKASGRFDKSEINTFKLEECSEKSEKLLNGKHDSHKNGHVKSSLLTNGVTVSTYADFLIFL